MSPSWIHPAQDPLNQESSVDMSELKPKSRGCLSGFRRLHITICGIIILIAIGLGIGLGVGLTQGGSSGEAPSPSPSSTPTPIPPTNTSGSIWQPAAGTTWQIVLLSALTLNETSSPNVSVFDIDLFDNPASTIESLHAQDRKVICYFSAGSYESNRPDSGNFTASDKGKELDGWPGEYWLNTKSSNVRSIMSARIALAESKGCDGVDPDNIDAYDNSNGLDLTTSDAVDYLSFLSTEAHGRNLSIGLKNGGTIVNQTIGIMQWEVNEQCVQYNECDIFQPFIQAGKPVFHIEYPKSAPQVSQATRQSDCNDASAQGFSTVLKNMGLDDWVETC